MSDFNFCINLLQFQRNAQVTTYVWTWLEFFLEFGTKTPSNTKVLLSPITTAYE